ncbi:MAG TPA: hypothetical protein PKH79_14700 [Prolixibacteraceae bacterium]|nr:hypothetical protein [Prolixibacteraceae bacterium]HPS13516.1 hypothetical protein [Prolixibacteraceae bacterium]
MKRFLLPILMLFIVPAFGQNLDNLLTQLKSDCATVSHNSATYFKKYVEENKLDSAKVILNYWESKCGNNREPVFRAKMLLALLKGEYNDSLTDQSTLNNVFNYKSRRDMIKYANYVNYDQYPSYYGNIGPGEEFDTFTQKTAIRLKDRYNQGTIEQLWCEFYGDNSDTLLSKIQSEEYFHTTLSKEYHKTVKKYLDLSEFHSAWIFGTWIPTGKLSTLGVHPDVGFMLGSKRKKMNYDLVMTIKFLKTANDYSAWRPKSDTAELTNHFLGAYIGFEVGRDLYARNGHELQLIGGVGFDMFDALEEDSTLNLEAASACSYNFNIGLGYRYYINDNLYIGLRAKYNLVDYTLKHVTELTGNTFSLQLVIGGVNNINRNDNLKSLKYKIRK